MPRSAALAAASDHSARGQPPATHTRDGRDAGVGLDADAASPPEHRAVRARILIVEDDAILALRIQKTIETMGYEVAGLTATGEDAVRLTEEVRPDVVLMDVSLRGEMTGVEAAARIHVRGDTPVIYVTAYSDDALIELAARTAPYAYLTKPIRDRELRASIESALYRSRTERALEESHDNWRWLVEYQPTGNIVHRNGTILYANRACLAILGVSSPEELVGRDMLAFVHEDWRAVVSARLLDLPKGSAPDTAEVALLRGGQPIAVEMTSLPVTYLGSPAIQSVVWDVTERRRGEEQLRRAQKLDSVGRLAAGVAHDFNNMLQGIIGHAELLKGKLHSSDARVEDVEEILAAAQRCSDLSRQLLAFSRQQMLHLRIVDLRDVVKRMESLLRGTLHEDVRLRIVVSEESCLVRADVGQLEQVLINLAVNAQDAMPTGGTLSVEVIPPSESREQPPAIDAPSGPWLELIVADTGCGMDAFTREHAFEPFFTSKEPGKGTGLGLAMVHGIVTQHGGSIQFDSEVAAGSTFTICLPACSEGAPEPTTEPELAGPVGVETVLVVEDTASVLSVTVSLLRRHGYSVLDADSGRAALARLEHHEGRVDLLLTDVVMPDMNGKELAARVRARFPAVKVLFMTGHDKAVVASHGVLEESVALIVKPFSSRDLAVRIRRVLDGA